MTTTQKTKSKPSAAEKSSVLVRGLLPDDLTWMEALALSHDRSLEAELRQAIHTYIAPFRLKAEFAERRTGLAQRLHFAHATFLEKHPDHSPKLSYLAQAIGEERAGSLESWFDGAPGAPFGTLEKLADYLGCSAT